MCTRFLLALTACAFVFSGGAVIADNENPPGDVLSAERICQFDIRIPAVLNVGECVPDPDGSGFFIDVQTNSCTTVAIDGSEFKRQERDCDGNLLDTVDTLEGAVTASFEEVVHCEDGGASLQIRDNGNGSWTLASHRGGYLVRLDASPLASQDLCDDAGCYRAEVKVTITAEPAEDCP